MPAKGTYGAARQRAKSQTFAKDVRDTAKAVGYALGGGLAGRAADALRKRQQDGQTTDSNNR